MTNTLEEKDWKLLLRRIKDGKCTPFIGAGACYGKIPLGWQIAQDWAQVHKYPLNDCSDLARVAQFLAVTQDAMYPKEEIKDIIKAHVDKVDLQYFKNPDEPHGVLADLPLPVYITTNYDDFMIKALESRNKKPKKELCRWNKYIQENLPKASELNPDVSNPVVFHFHGSYEMPESLVLTEDDYFDFLVNISEDKSLIPARIQQALTGASLLFLGYKIADLDLRVLLRGLDSYFEKSISRAHLSVQLVPEVNLKRYLFNWNEIPKNDNVRLIDFLNINYNLEWVKKAKIEKIDNDKTIRVSTENNFILLKLNNEKTKLNIEIDDSRKDEFIAEIEKDKLNIYKQMELKEQEEQAQKYLNKYFNKLDIRVYWGDCREFSAELKRRWDIYKIESKVVGL